MISGFFAHEKGNAFTWKKPERLERSRFLFYNGRIMSRMPGGIRQILFVFNKNRIV